MLREGGACVRRVPRKGRGMTVAAVGADVLVIDTDTHATEPAGLWTSRLARKWADQVPGVEVNPDIDEAVTEIGRARDIGHRGIRFAYKYEQILATYPDNFMFETDYADPTSMSPGPVSPADMPSVHIARHFSGLDPVVARRALHDNVARVYHLDES